VALTAASGSLPVTPTSSQLSLIPRATPVFDINPGLIRAFTANLLKLRTVRKNSTRNWMASTVYPIVRSTTNGLVDIGSVQHRLSPIAVKHLSSSSPSSSTDSLRVNAIDLS
jgi:hypothetical protein